MSAASRGHEAATVLSERENKNHRVRQCRQKCQDIKMEIHLCIVIAIEMRIY